MAVIELPEMDLSNIEVPDVSKLELPKLDMGKARKSVEKARRQAEKARAQAEKAGSQARGRVADSLPRRSGPSPVPFLLFGLIAGAGIGYWLATSPYFGPRIRETVDQLKARVDQARSSAPDEFDELGAETEHRFDEMTSAEMPASGEPERQTTPAF